MSQQNLNYGSSPGDGNGDMLYTIFKMVQENFDSLFGAGVYDDSVPPRMVYPTSSGWASIAYVTDTDRVQTMTTSATVTEGTGTWTLQFVYTAFDQISTVTVTNTLNADVWVETYSYDVNDLLVSTTGYLKV